MAISKLAERLRLSGSPAPSQNPANSNHTAVREPPHRTDTYNVVIFGECGAGKSSLVNLISGENMAVISSDAGGCTRRTNEHEIRIQNETLKVKLFDTAGLDEDPRGTVPDKEARRMLKELVRTLMEEDDLHLMMYCVRGETGIRALRRNYKFIHSEVKKKNVPIVLIVTSLESYEPDMEEWWRLNTNIILNHGMTFAGHACVTTGMITQSGITECGRKQSYDAVCKLIEQCRLSNETSVVHKGPSRGTTIYSAPPKMAASNKHAHIVLFGQAGAGKSSLVNLMAGKSVARTSNDMKSCTLRWEEYSIQFNGESYNVFDTVGLEEPQLGIPQYLDAVENAYTLIQQLEKRGSIDLLLFCMRAGRVTATLQSNYRLFHEFLCDKKVPVVVVITHLENEVGEMDAWWTRNKNPFREREVYVAGHACITAIRGDYPARYEQSRITIRNIVKEFTADGQKAAWKGGDNTLVSFLHKLREFLVVRKSRAKKHIVPCLVKRCGLSLDVATKLADRINNGVVEGAT